MRMTRSPCFEAVKSGGSVECRLKKDRLMAGRAVVGTWALYLINLFALMFVQEEVQEFSS